MYRLLSGQKSVAFRHGGLIHEMSNVELSYNYLTVLNKQNKYPLSRQYRS